MQHIPQPKRIADVYGLIKPVVTLHLLDGLRGNLHRTPAATGASALTHLSHLETHDLTFHRAARHEVRDDEYGQRDTEKCGNDEKKPADEVACHGFRDCTSVSF